MCGKRRVSKYSHSMTSVESMAIFFSERWGSAYLDDYFWLQSILVFVDHMSVPKTQRFWRTTQWLRDPQGASCPPCINTLTRSLISKNDEIIQKRSAWVRWKGHSSNFRIPKNALWICWHSRPGTQKRNFKEYSRGWSCQGIGWSASSKDHLRYRDRMLDCTGCTWISRAGTSERDRNNNKKQGTTGPNWKNNENNTRNSNSKGTRTNSNNNIHNSNNRHSSHGSPWLPGHIWWQAICPPL